MQDAMLVALQRLGGLRDPAVVGPWLKAITRNAARMRLRSAHDETPLAEQAEDVVSRAPTPEQILDNHSLRDWVWSALETLSEPLQVAVLLRYFTQAGSYGQIAAVCGISVGTVRSRLHQARRTLSDALRESSAAAHDDTAALITRRRRQADDLITSARRGQFRPALEAITAPNLVLFGPQGQQSLDRDTLVRMMDSDLDAGVRQRLMHVTAGRRVTILECDLLNPISDPQHCPPGVLWLMTLQDERIDRIKLFHPIALPRSKSLRGNPR